MVSDEDLSKKIVELLDTADLTTTTTSHIRKQLEQVFGIDLSDKKSFLRAQIDLYLQTHVPHQESAAQRDNENALQEQGVKCEADDIELEHGEGLEAEEEEEGEGEDEEDDDDDDEEEETINEEDDEDQKINWKPEQDSKRLQAKIRRAKKESLQKKKKKRSGGGGFAKLCKLSPELQALTGQEELPRTQVVKVLWEYIREKNLQNPANKRMIVCDDVLRPVFGTDTIDMFRMNKLLTKHIWPLDDESKSKRLKLEEEGTPEIEKVKNKEKQKTEKETQEKEVKKGKGGGLTTPIPLSEALVEFFGTGENELPRTEVVRRMWAYIKENNLQNPADKRLINCDKKLQALLGCDTFFGFSITKHLAAHFIKS